MTRYFSQVLLAADGGTFVPLEELSVPEEA